MQRAISHVSGTNVNLFLSSGRIRSDPFSRVVFGLKNSAFARLPLSSSRARRTLHWELTPFGGFPKPGAHWAHQPCSQPRLRAAYVAISTNVFAADFVVKGASERVLDTVFGVIHHRGKLGTVLTREDRQNPSRAWHPPWPLQTPPPAKSRVLRRFLLLLFAYLFCSVCSLGTY